MSTIIHGAGGGADTSVVTAVATDVLSPKVIVDVNGNPLVGTIQSKAIQTFTPGTANQIIAAGQYLAADQTILGDVDLISGNIKSGINIFGVAGNSNVVDTSAGDAVAGDMLSGKKAYVDGALVTGTIPSRALSTITPGTANQTIAAGQYLSGVQTILGDADLIAANILSTANIFGVQGTSPVIGNTENGTISSAQTTTTITLLKKPVAFFALASSSNSPYPSYSGAIVMPNDVFYKIYTNPNGESYNINSITWLNNVVTITLAVVAPRLRWFAWEVA